MANNMKIPRISDLPDPLLKQIVEGALIRPHPYDISPLRVLVIGHSFIRRTHTFIKENLRDYDNFHLWYNEAQVSILGLGGATIQDFIDKLTTDRLDIVDVVRPEVVIIQLGTKELGWHSVKPEDLGESMRLLVKELLDRRVRRVVVCKTLKRGKAGLPPTMPHFNGRVTIYNNWIKNNLTADPRVCIWNHRGFIVDIEKHVDRKGLHMNEYGQIKLYRSYKGCILYYLAVLRPALC